MFCLKSIANDVLPFNTEVSNRVEKSNYEVDYKIQHQNVIKKIKILNIEGIKEKKILKVCENNYVIINCCSTFICYSKFLQLEDYSEYIVYEREYYLRDLEMIIQIKSFTNSDVCDIICLMCDILMIFSEYNMVISNLKSSNVVYDENDDIKLCDLFLDELRKEEDMRICDLSFKSPEELNGLECNERSIIWSIGCILYEMICKKLPFNEDNNMNKTMNNIQRCKYSLDVKCDKMMKEMIKRMLKVKSEDRMSLKELKKEVIKMNEILKDRKGNWMIYEEKKEILYNGDDAVVMLPIIYPSEYYVNSKYSMVIRDSMIKSYNNEYDERVLSVLLAMKLFKEKSDYNKPKNDDSITTKLKFHIYHNCKEKLKECYLDEILFSSDI